MVLEHFIEGVSWRLGYDLICLSGPRDQQALAQLVAGTLLRSSARCSPACGGAPAQTSPA